MRMGNHVIRFELLSALLHSTLCYSAPIIFCRNLSEQFCQRLPLAFFIALIHTWSQMYSRFAAYLAPLHPISRGRLRATLDQIFRQSFITFCLSLQNCQGTVSSTRRILVGSRVTTRSGFCSVRAMSWGTLPHSGRQTIQH